MLHSHRREVAMMTLEIPRPQWRTFFDRTTRLHADEPILLEILRLDLAAQVAIDGLPLVGITANGDGEDEWIEIAAGSEPEGHVSHRVAHPLHVHLLRRLAEDDDVLEILSADRTTTLLHFDAPASGAKSLRKEKP
jgi:hypothetical protein